MAPMARFALSGVLMLMKVAEFFERGASVAPLIEQSEAVLGRS